MATGASHANRRNIAVATSTHPSSTDVMRPATSAKTRDWVLLGPNTWSKSNALVLLALRHSIRELSAVQRSTGVMPDAISSAVSGLMRTYTRMFPRSSCRHPARNASCSVATGVRALRGCRGAPARDCAGADVRCPRG
jgi:hypothetical protein